MPRQVSLAVSINVEPPHHPPAFNGRLPDGGVDGFPLPLDVAWQPTFTESKRGIARFSWSSIKAILSRELLYRWIAGGMAGPASAQIGTFVDRLLF